MQGVFLVGIAIGFVMTNGVKPPLNQPRSAINSIDPHYDLLAIGRTCVPTRYTCRKLCGGRCIDNRKKAPIENMSFCCEGKNLIKKTFSGKSGFKSAFGWGNNRPNRS